MRRATHFEVIRVLTPALFAFAIVAIAMPSISDAQRPMQKMRDRIRENMPKGELLKKLRDEIAGSKKDKKDKKDDADKNKQKVSTKNDDRQPTPAVRRSPNGERPFRLSDPDSKTSPSIRDEQPTAVFETSDSKALKKEYDNKGLVVRNTPKLGILAEAGIRRGDRIVGIGGLPVDGQKDIDAVLDILKKGDQVEVVLVRNGKYGALLAANGKYDPIDLEGSTPAPGPPSGNARGRLGNSPKITLPNENDIFDPRNSTREQDVDPKPTTIQNDYFRSVMELPGRTSGQSKRQRGTNSNSPGFASGTSSRSPAERANAQDEQIIQLQREIEKLKRELRTDKDSKPSGVTQAPRPSVTEDKSIGSVFDLLDENKSKNK